VTNLLEWLSREGHLIFAWWLWTTLAGAAVFPLCLRLLGALPDKGYTLVRTVGMLLVTFVFWLLASYGFLDNSVGSIVLSWLLVLILSLFIYARFGSLRDILDWWRANRLVFLVAELLFLCLFVIWAIYRAHYNQIFHTEQPMELAFMSAIQRSQTFPPNDPWLAGFAISYYYKGYVMSSMLSMLSGITSVIGFNLTIASQFALTGLTAFGVAYNLVRSRAFARFRSHTASPALAIATGLLAMLLMIGVGNFQAVLIEAPYQSQAAPQSYLEFWGTQARSNFAEEGERSYQRIEGAPFMEDPSQWDNWWWFRASRVLTDYELDGSLSIFQPIDEFPAFSFLLADNHPHVLALPFAIMIIGMMLNLVLTRRSPTRSEILLYGIAVGGLVFLNTWDGPIYLLGLVGAEGLRRLMLNDKGKLNIGDWLQLCKLGLMLAGIVIIAYLPFIIGFRSQAGGILPNLLHPTLFRRFFIMFGPLILILSLFLLTETWRGIQFRAMNWRLGLSLGGVILLGLLGVMLILTALGASNPAINAYARSFIDGWSAVIPLLVQRRIEFGLTTVVLLVAVILVIARLFPAVRPDEETEGSRITYPAATGFALLLIGMGLSLTLFPEFLYLKDNFNTRINTIFKFYYQAWAVWSIGGAYAVWSIIADNRLPRPAWILRLGTAILVALALMAGLMYTAFGIYHRAWIESGRHNIPPSRQYAPPDSWDSPIRQVSEGMRVEPGGVLYINRNLNDNRQSLIIQANQSGIVSVREDSIALMPLLTLDGRDSMINRDDLNVITCLSDLVGKDDAVVAEAVREAYNLQYGRVGTLTGIPIVLGWENHERQWRGATYAEAAGTRRADIDKLYLALDITLVTDIIERYDISYILYGSTERMQYGSAGEEKFMDNLPIVCESGDSRIFFVQSPVQAH